MLLHKVPSSANWQRWQRQGDNNGYIRSSYDWSKRQLAHPIPKSSITHLPKGVPRQLPRIQHKFSVDELTQEHNETQRQRQNAVKEAAAKSWAGYQQFAWGQDELTPLSLKGKTTFNGWGATLVDSLSTLWIMGLKQEFKEAVRKVAAIDWDNTTSPDCNLFETNIRYLGGLLSAYDLSGDKILLSKAIELGNMLYAAFDTPNHFPAIFFHFKTAKQGKLVAHTRESLATVASLSLEFTRLSQITGDPKYYSAVDHIKVAMELSQDDTKLPGMWPTFVNLRHGFLTGDSSFTLGAAADSAYEYLSKMHILLGGLDPTYEKMHTKAIETAKKHLLFRPMLSDQYPATPPDILFSGTVYSNTKSIDLSTEVQHLGCFAGGMFALGGKLFRQDEDVKIGEQLARGCAWAYNAFPTGIMPEISYLVACEHNTEETSAQKRTTTETTGSGTTGSLAHLAPCEWNESRWRKNDVEPPKVPKPFSSVQDSRYLLRPEAIESVFILYRITGQRDLLDIAWRMFQSIKKATETRVAHAAISDVQGRDHTAKVDAMEVSFHLPSVFIEYSAPFTLKFCYHPRRVAESCGEL